MYIEVTQDCSDSDSDLTVQFSHLLLMITFKIFHHLSSFI